MPYQLVIELGRDDLPRTEDACTRLGAIALSLADAGDEPLLEPAPGETPLWHEVRLRALFPETPEPGLLAATLAAVLGLPADAIRCRASRRPRLGTRMAQGLPSDAFRPAPLGLPRGPAAGRGGRSRTRTRPGSCLWHRHARDDRALPRMA